MAIWITWVPFQLAWRSLKILQQRRATDFRTLFSKDCHYKYTNLVYIQYVRLQLIMISGQDEDAQSLFILMVLGAILSSLANFCTIRLLNVRLPILFYSVFPMASIAILIIAQQMLPVAVGVNEKASEALQKWIVGLNNGKLNSSERRFLKIKLQALRSIRYHGGLNGFYFFVADKTIKREYFGVIVTTTLNLLLSFPAVRYRY
ncbi:uncharacterized protein LOC118433155 [Folsomia candida]|uniref:uncharacterized protein LOC118433155 n=1 Tax=Folsomia candida TaxID=158441 RepID=UPI0016051D7D|nr:uncharacterized protein LOC118433155 [Folsomia candida]